MKARTRAARLPRLTGFCAARNHQFCRGGHSANPDHEWVPCICPCHTNQEDHVTADPLADATARTQRLQAVMDSAYEGTPPLSDPLAGLTLVEAVALVVAATERLDTAAYGTGITDVDWHDAIRLLDRLRTATDNIATVRSALDAHVYLTGEHGDVEVEGVGRVKVARARDRKDWDHRGAVQAVLDAKMEERGGEVPSDVWEVADWILDVVGVNYVRVTPLRALGIEPAAFCTDVPGRAGVSLPARR